MRADTPSIPSSLGKRLPRSPASDEELRAMRAAVWHQQAVVVVPLGEISNDWDREYLKAIASRLYGQRKEGQLKGNCDEKN